jgi:hypothetical protein
MSHPTAWTHPHPLIVQLGEEKRVLGSSNVERSSCIMHEWVDVRPESTCLTRDCSALHFYYITYHSHRPLAAMASSLPSVLVLGGVLEGTASAILTHLWPSNASKHRKASYIRIADKFLILPQSDTFLKWVHPEARKVLHDGCGRGVDYMQANIVGGAPSVSNGSLRPAYRISDVISGQCRLANQSIQSS